jgi:hypothetical protein
MACGAQGARAQMMAAEWTQSISTPAMIERLVNTGVLPVAVIGGWWTSIGESYLDPRPGEIVVFKDFYWRGFRNPCHPFLHKLCDYYRVSICNLHPNSILVVSIFIALCEAYLGIQPHFNLCSHFFYLKKKGEWADPRLPKGPIFFSMMG